MGKGNAKSVSTKEEQTNSWPMYLPAIASSINNKCHSTINDIPFRIYNRREPSTVVSTIIPDDSTWDEVKEDQRFDDEAKYDDDQIVNFNMIV